MVIGVLASCDGTPSEETNTSEEVTTSQNAEESTTTDKETETNASTATEESEKETEVETDEGIVDVKYEGKDAHIVNGAYELTNGVSAYFSDYTRKQFTVVNQNMSFEYNLDKDGDQLITYIKNKNGVPYVENTMDVFVRMTDGNTYYSSKSVFDAKANIHRLGVYLYEIHFEEQVFTDGYTVKRTQRLPMDIKSTKHMTVLDSFALEGNFQIDTNAEDPQVVLNNIDYDADIYNFLEVDIKVDARVGSNMELFIQAGSQTRFNQEQSYNLTIQNDGEYHTYLIPLYSIYDYTGELKGLRFDFSGADGLVSIKNVKLLAADLGDAPSSLTLCRSFSTYSDKLHQTIQVVATVETDNIEAIGMVTRIPSEKVAKLVVKDASDTHETIDGVDWSSMEYVGFDIVDAGIFGYILPFDGKGGNIKVELIDGNYVIEQTKAPENNIISPSIAGTDNANDFYMGQRIYTDDGHDFTEFLHEAYCERNPIKDMFIRVSEETSDEAKYVGYDSLRGIYEFYIDGPKGGFSIPYNKYPNKHFKLEFDIVGDTVDRRMYVLAASKTTTLESAVLLNEHDMLLPVAIEVGKNFSEAAGDRTIYDMDDVGYSESIFPVFVEARSRENSYTLLHPYQNWGKYPLKQISWIKYYAPYYHVSTGVTETNCIVPWYWTKLPRSFNTLPDFRGMSSPFWENGEPQHTSCGFHTFLQYTDSESNFVASENVSTTIDSYGPTYMDVIMDNLSDDGKIKVTYIHTEMPQTDENRCYYEMKYEVLEDVTIADFKKDFAFYSVRSNDNGGTYTKVGYLDVNNESQVVDALTEGEHVSYVLGDQSPYFSFFHMDTWTNVNGYSNVGFVVYNSEFIIGGEKVTPNFIVTDKIGTLSLSLNLDEVTLKAGDTFTINAIIMPWGWQGGDYERDDPDWNVREVRENSCLAPLTATAIENCEVLEESVFLPKLTSTNGKNATFTLSGGENNVTVRIYGFDILTAPKVEELIDDEWTEYVLNSSTTPDVSGNLHYYDGYGVHYDGEGKFSYSFVTTMTDGAPRTFRISAEESFKPWPAEPVNKFSNNENHLNLYFDPEEISNLLIGTQYISAAELSDDYSYVRLYGKGTAQAEAYMVFTADKDYEIDTMTGQYLVFKYRLPTTNKTKATLFDIYANTGSTAPNNSYRIQTKAIQEDGEWHTIVVDMSSKFTAKDGEYFAQHIRIDFFNTPMPDTDYIDVAYFGAHHSLAEIAEINRDLETFTLITASETIKIDTSTGEKYQVKYLDEASGLTESTLEYAGHVDTINGMTYGVGGNSLAGIGVIEYNSKTLDGALLKLGGWTVVRGGVANYIWSADNGLTWHDATLNSVTAADSKILAGAASRLGITGDAQATYFTVDDTLRASFQNGKMVIDLSEYDGQKVDVVIAAVPVADKTTICPIVYISGVSVLKSVPLVQLDEPIDLTGFVDADSEYSGSRYPFVGQIDSINGVTVGSGFNSLTGLSNENAIFNYNAAITDCKLTLKGWVVIEGSVKNFVWSADNGKTWNTISSAGIYSLSATILSRAGSDSYRLNNTHTFDSRSATSGGFQTNGIVVDLTAYKGSTVDILVAAVPAADEGTPTICPVVYIKGIQVK